MSGLKEKIQDIHFAVFVVRCLRKKYRAARDGFSCLETVDTDCGNEFIEYECFEAGIPMFCHSYDSHNPCSDDTCPRHVWNVQYIDLLNRFRAAKRTRNHAILNLFKVRHK